ncbi:cystathionine beta-lyase, partial [Phenylobacterium sp.]|uniref:cystathionine beta-lyase n=1 Tax=Phenylobacterium sp. TaxID=1871053 RepID=UPI00272F630F
RIAELEGAHRTYLVPGGLAAITATYLVTCKAGSHALLPASAYPPNRELGEGVLARFGIEVEHYDPLIGGAIASLIRDNTALIWCESPGSITMEIQDVPAIAAAAKARGVPVALDNTYAAGVLFDAFAARVDISIQALTKYVGGHSDVFMGSVAVRDRALVQAMDDGVLHIGWAVSPDDAYQMLRGLRTLATRMARHDQSARRIAAWLAERPEVAQMRHPALPGCPGHDIWRRDYSGACGLFAFTLKPAPATATAAFLNALKVFGLGFSWGGFESLAIDCGPQLRCREDGGAGDGALIRLHIGLEDPDDLIADLTAALDAWRSLA